jgi:DNA polymerase-3 subunit epsilon
VKLPPPPQGPPWDLALDEAPLAFVDLEMTGLDASKDRVVEICIERVRGGAVEDRLHTLVRPTAGAPAPGRGVVPRPAPDDEALTSIGNEHVHGIAAEALAGAPTFPEIRERVAALLDGAVLVAHGAVWDVAFLEAEMARAGTPYTVGHWLDTLNLSRRTFALPRHSLAALREHFGIDATRAHRADADVAALREVFSRCVAALEPKTARDLWEVRIAQKKAREQIIAECTQAVASKKPVTVVYRPRARPPEPMRMVLTEVLSGLDPPRVIGYQLPGRGRRELRADRILRIEIPES